jgi:hypothetical protein
MEDQFGTYTSRFAALEEQLQDQMAQWTSDHLAGLKNNVKTDGNQIRQRVHTDCQSTIVGLTDANRSSIDAFKVKFLCKMTEQIKEALMEEKREFHALAMDTFTIPHNHLERSSSCLTHGAVELQRRKTCNSCTQLLDNNFHTSPATMNPSPPTHGPPTSTVDTHTVSVSPLPHHHFTSQHFTTCWLHILHWTLHIGHISKHTPTFLPHSLLQNLLKLLQNLLEIPLLWFL